MPQPKVAKSKRPEAERAAEHFMQSEGGFGCFATRRALRTKFAKVDFFAADIIGVCDRGFRYWVQVTAGQASAARIRRRKLEKYPWHPSDRVLLFQLTHTEDPMHRARKKWWFRTFELVREGKDQVLRKKWITWTDPIPVPPEWFKAYKEKE